MAAPSNHWKLGLFVVAGLLLTLGTVVVIGARSMQEDVGVYVSFFDESVQGLEVGSPIKFRGVTIGSVGKIQVAPDRRHVEVESELGVDELTRLGLDIAKEKPLFGAPRRLVMAPDLRLQLASGGLTGVKFLQLDFFDVAQYPPPELPFKVPDNTIPTAPSMMKSLEDSLLLIANRLPEITDQVSSIAGEIDAVVRDINDRQIPERIVSTLDTMDGLLTITLGKVAQVDAKGLSRSGNRTLRSITGAADRLDGILAHIDEDDGLLTSVERASDAVGDTLRDAEGLGGQLVDTLESVQTSARSIRKLTEALEQDPEMLMKGRTPEKKQDSTPEKKQ
jgi:ABC-type transporter Mla subunit MlaD